ncbi:hypothetical protein V6N13_023293 [Hibiscus sabdariffa]|uniref:Uncharacterized protein n=1 Tax=Hibiscus sabdariffa TaxID=183260 RepID=A0ABR2B4Y7_9ROSI
MLSLLILTPFAIAVEGPKLWAVGWHKEDVDLMHSLGVDSYRKGANVKGYYAWSLPDDFEWNNGYTIEFGLHHVDRKTLTRRPKSSATRYKNLVAEHSKVKDQQQAEDVENGLFYY